MRNGLSNTAVSVSCILLLSICMLMCASESGKKISGNEISNHDEVISCNFQGLGQRNDTPVVDLVFNNKTGKNLKAVYGGIRIIDEEGAVVQSTGFTYSMPFLKNESKHIAAFEYIPLKPDALKILKKESAHVPVIFQLSEVVFENGESAEY